MNSNNSNGANTGETLVDGHTGQMVDVIIGMTEARVGILLFSSYYLVLVIGNNSIISKSTIGSSHDASTK